MKKLFTRSIRNPRIWILLLAAVMHMAALAQTSHVVDVTNNLFTPDAVSVQVGDTVIWTNSQGRHNVNGLQSKFPDNPESFGNSVGSGWEFSHVFTIPGLYDYQCDPHVQFGMVGKVIVMEDPPDTLTINMNAMTPHVGQTGWLLVTDNDSGEEIERSSGTIEENFTLKVPGIVAGHSYTVEIFADHNSNGYYDPPPTDHAWRMEIQDAGPGEVLDFTHNTNFTDIEWEHRAVVNLSGMTPHLGQEIYFALIDVETGEVVDRKSEIVEESFTVELGELINGKSYYLDFFSDHNDNGFYDPPPADHAWRLEIPSALGDDTLDFAHNTNFTDIQWKHRLRVRFSGMTPHFGQELTLYVKDLSTRETLDTLVTVIEDADFDLKSYVIQAGRSYVADFYSDHNGNGMYDAPPADHAWRIETGEAGGDVDLDFQHNTNFTDINSSLGPDVLLANDPEFGMILTDGLGYTLYYFTKDALPDTSLCTGGCVDNWPLFYVENPELGEGLDMADFGSIEHPEGGMQTTYKGWPLYYWVNDQAPGETSGEAVGNVWFVAKPDYTVMLMDGLLIGQDGVTYNSNYEPGEEMVQYFVDEYGRTLYIFINDNYDQNNYTKSDFSNNAVWPIYEVELQSVASTLDRSLFGSIDVFGRSQLTYKGWPLYYFREASVRGDATGVSVPRPGVWPVAVQGLEAPVVSSVENFNAAVSLVLYPNPAADELTLVSEDMIETVSLLNFAGVRIATLTNIQAKEHRLNLEGINPGIYLVEVRTENNQLKYSRFVKQ